MTSTIVKKNTADHRYEAFIADERVGLITYRESGDVVVLPHTEVDPAFGGRGIAGELTRFALDDVRGQGKLVNPACPYIAAWITKHPEYADLVA